MSQFLSALGKVVHEIVECVKKSTQHATSSKTSQALIFGGCVGALVYFWIKRRRRFPPGPFALPFFGNVFALRKKEPLYVTLDRWVDESYGPVISLQLGPVSCVTLNRLDQVVEALIEKGEDFSGRHHVCSLRVQTEGFKDIIFADQSAAWKLCKKITSRALTRYLESGDLDSVVHHVVGIVTDKMAEETDAFDPRPYLSSLVFHLLDTVCFGELKDFDHPSIQRISSVFHALVEESGQGFVEDLLPILRFAPTRKFRKFEELLGQFLDYIHLQVDEHRDTFSRGDCLRDVVDCLLAEEEEEEGKKEEEGEKEMEGEEEAGKGGVFTATHVGQIINDIFGGGVETLQQTLEWALLFMAGYPEEQARVHAEIDNLTVGQHWPVSADRPKLIYTEATLCEILRLGSAVPLGIPHKTLRHTTVGGYDIPANTMILINHWALLRDPDQWDSPTEFRPSRFLDNDGKLKADVKSWVPFSVGDRACLGESLAKRQLLLVLACLLKRFEVSLPPSAGVEGMGWDWSPLCGDGLITHAPKPYRIILTER
ncbi:cytochrome P450 1A5-like [Babylonia areolata]|uniref:cytochrome P450 1A5-like n=1 Tax=Babylonia areolata TaxID=304850 RepID=UPI003FCFEF68